MQQTRLSTTSQFGTSNGVLHCSLSPHERTLFRSYFAGGGGVVPATCDAWFTIGCSCYSRGIEQDSRVTVLFVVEFHLRCHLPKHEALIDRAVARNPFRSVLHQSEVRTSLSRSSPWRFSAQSVVLRTSSGVHAARVRSIGATPPKEVWHYYK